MQSRSQHSHSEMADKHIFSILLFLGGVTLFLLYSDIAGNRMLGMLEAWRPVQGMFDRITRMVSQRGHIQKKKDKNANNINDSNKKNKSKKSGRENGNAAHEGEDRTEGLNNPPGKQ